MRCLLGILAALSIGCSSPGGKGDATVHLDTASGATISIAVEVVDTAPARAQGLMFRESLDAGRGMLFLFEQESIQSFWMKNTKIPLDILFISDAGEVVGIAENTTPFSLDSIRVDRPSRIVLEVPAGFSKSAGLEAGNRVRYENLKSPLAPKAAEAPGK